MPAVALPFKIVSSLGYSLGNLILNLALQVSKLE